MNDEILTLAIDLAKQARTVIAYYNSLMLLESDSFNYQKTLFLLKKAIKEEQEIYLKVPDLFKLNEYIIASLEKVQGSLNAILFLRMNDICEYLILKKLETKPQESINNFLAKSLESTCLINGLYILEHKISQINDISLSIKLRKIKYECACYNQLIENILIKNNFIVPSLSYKEPYLFANLIDNHNIELLERMKINITQILLKDFLTYLIDNLDNKTKVIEYTSYLESTLGILNKEERIKFFSKIEPLFSQYPALSFHILTLFSNLETDLKLIKN